MSEDKVHQLVRFDSTNAQSIAQQLLENVTRRVRNDETIGVVVCTVLKLEDGSNQYEVAFSDLPTECVVYAADKIRRRAVEVLEL